MLLFTTQPKQKIPPKNLLLPALRQLPPPKPKHLCPSQGQDRAKAALLHQGAQAAQGRGTVAADVEPAAGQEASSSTQPLMSTLLKRAELALGTGGAEICPEEWSFNCHEAVCASIREAGLAEEMVEASLAGRCSAFPILPPGVHHLPPSITKLELSS